MNDDELKVELADALGKRWRWLTGDARADLLADAEALLPIVRRFASFKVEEVATYLDQMAEFSESPSEAQDWHAAGRHIRRRARKIAEPNPTEGLWGKRNTPSGAFEAIKRSGDVFKGVKREN